ncbi:major facilitator superfamily transporter, partial [Apiospora phragmitis]
DNATVILACGILYVVYTFVNASLSVLFIDIYGLNQWQTGLIYLPFGLGGTISTFFSGTLLDNAYRKAMTRRVLPTDKVSGDDLDSFPIEKARLGVIWAPMILTTMSVVAFGWVLQLRKNIAIPLALQFIAGLCMQLNFSIYNTLLVDKNHRTPAAAQASSNIVRCTLAAIVIAFMGYTLDAMGIGWTFTFLGGKPADGATVTPCNGDP